jgi:hypothetical protein
MDLELELSPSELTGLLAELGLKRVELKGDVVEAEARLGRGRLHILAKAVAERRVYVDVHWDAPIHFLMLGVDYSKRPRRLCEELLGAVVARGRRGRVTGGRGWFTRRNRAILSGLRV